MEKEQRLKSSLNYGSSMITARSQSQQRSDRSVRNFLSDPYPLTLRSNGNLGEDNPESEAFWKYFIGTRQNGLKMYTENVEKVEEIVFSYCRGYGVVT